MVESDPEIRVKMFNGYANWFRELGGVDRVMLPQREPGEGMGKSSLVVYIFNII